MTGTHQRTSARATAAPGLPRGLGVAAAAWSLAQLAAGLAWTAGRGGYPFVADEADPFGALLAGLGAHAVAPAIAAMGAATLLALLVAGRRRTGPGATVAAAVLAASAAVMLLVVPDVRLLAAVAYTPLLLAGTPFGWFGGATVAEAWTWPLAYQALSVAGGLAWAATALVVRRRSRRVCARCGRGAAPGRWSAPTAAARWGRWAVAVAVVVPLLYAATRFAWALGIPLGISEAVLREGQELGLWMTGAGLAALAVAGAALTLGLHQPWGEVLPRWLPLIGGRRVPPAVATVPALVVATLVTSAGLGFARLLAAGAFEDFFAGTGWAVIGPELLWPFWGAALAAAALAYHLRRRGPCPACGPSNASG